MIKMFIKSLVILGSVGLSSSVFATDPVLPDELPPVEFYCIRDGSGQLVCIIIPEPEPVWT